MRFNSWSFLVLLFATFALYYAPWSRGRHGKPTRPCGSVGMLGEPHERNGALPNDRQNKHQKAGQASFGQPKVWLEMFAEGLHSGFGGSGIVFLVSHNQRLTPRFAIC